jgi:hypothetical protein
MLVAAWPIPDSVALAMVGREAEKEPGDSAGTPKP